MAQVTRVEADAPVVQVDNGMELGERTSLWMDTNAKLVNILLGALVVVALGWTVYRWVHQGRQANASRAYASVLEQLNTAETQTDEAKRKEALNAAITASDDVIKNHGGTFVGRQAQLLLGNAHYELATLQTDQKATALNSARDAYQKYISMSSEPKEKAAGYVALGNVLQDQLFISQDTKLVADAENAYKQAADAGKGTFLEAQAKLHLANMYQALGNRQSEAEKLYQEIAQSRKVELPTDDKKPALTADGSAIAPEKIAEMKSFANLSYANMASTALDRLPAIKAPQ